MMTEQVTSVEQSKRLLELGVPANKASMEWKTRRIKDYDYDWTLDIACNGGRCIGNHNTFMQIMPAFTVADLLGMLPAEINTDYFGRCFLSFNKYKCHADTWHLYYKDDAGYTFFECTSEQGIIPVLFATVESLKKMGYLTE